MMPTKMSGPAKRLVSTASILWERFSLLPFCTSTCGMNAQMASYRLPAMMEATSSSMAASSSMRQSSRAWAFTLLTPFCSSSSPSSILMASNRLAPYSSMTWATAFSTGSAYVRGSGAGGGSASIRLMSSAMPVCFRALTVTTGQPSWRLRAAVSMRMPRCSSKSHMFRATTMGRPVSMSWELRYRLRSRLVASTTLIIMSGLSSSRYWRDTTSSGE